MARLSDLFAPWIECWQSPVAGSHVYPRAGDTPMIGSGGVKAFRRTLRRQGTDPERIERLVAVFYARNDQ